MLQIICETDVGGLNEQYQEQLGCIYAKHIEDSILKTQTLFSDMLRKSSSARLVQLVLAFRGE
jgi:hypothetical protein